MCKIVEINILGLWADYRAVILLQELENRLCAKIGSHLEVLPGKVSIIIQHIQHASGEVNLVLTLINLGNKTSLYIDFFCKNS